MKKIIYDFLLENTDSISLYTGGGSEPNFVHFPESEDWGRESFLDTISERLQDKLKQEVRTAYEQGAKDYERTSKTLTEFLSSDVDEYMDIIYMVEKEEEKTIPITYGLIKATCGWSKWCDVTDGNHYAINEWGDYPDNEVFYITESQAKQLNFI